MISLSQEQERAIHQAASEMLAAAVIRRPARLADATLSGAAEQAVLGAFVSLKRRGRLRACCGFLGTPTHVAGAISQAARRTATEDPRLPPVSLTELPYLDLEVWLLHGVRPMTARGADRVSEVSVGRHGLHVRRGNASGLLLPGVAVENYLTAEAFLEQVCLKAGLPPTAWKEDDTQVMTFEGHAITGPLDRRIAAEATATPSTFLTASELSRLADHCRSNILALRRGAMANCYLLGCADGNVGAVSLALRLPDSPDVPRFSKLSLRPGLPLQATLYALAEAAARALANHGIALGALTGLQVDLTILWDPAMHGTVMEPDLDGIDPGRRAVLVLEGTKWAWIYDPQRSARELISTATREAGVRSLGAAPVMSLATVSTEASLLIVDVPRPQAGPRIRPPAVAGSFYPGEAEALRRMVEGLLDTAGHQREPWPAVLVPHAGLKYSGKIAAMVFSRVEIPELIIVLGPRHRRLGADWAVAPHETWALPGGTVASDPALARQLAAAIPDLQLDALAHQGEHSIEVQLPILARLAPNTRVVGIALGAGDLDRCRDLASGLAGVLRGRPDPPLLVISSDLNHYASDSENRRLDAIALAALERLDPAHLYETILRHKISMCGLRPAVVVLETLRQLGTLRKSRRVAYGTSAEVTGDPSRVVGYVGMLFGTG
jgi:AmmeMemoRadiSam system protein B/AmmeMemoRadiSam system protein A